MAKKALLKDTFREIKRTFSRFMSILAIVALGVGFFSGIKATGPDMKLTGDKYFKDTNLMDLKLVSTMGFDEEDIEAVKSVDGVKDVEPSYSIDTIYADLESKPVVSVHAIPDKINKPVLKDGRMPQNENECLAESGGMYSEIQIGDTVHIASDDGKSPISDWLLNDTYTVVGLVESPMYISYEYGSSTIGDGSVNTFLMIDKENFKSEYYTQLYITADKPDDMSAFDYSYDTLVSDIKEELEDISPVRIEARYDEVVDRANEELSVNKKDFESAKRKSEQKLSDAKRELDDSLNQLNDAKAQIESGENKLKQEERDGKNRIENSRNELDDAFSAYRNELASFNEKKQSTINTLQNTEKELDAAQSQLEQNQAALDSNRDELAGMRKKLDESWSEYNNGAEDVKTYKMLADSADAAFNAPESVTKEQLDMLCVALGAVDIQTAADMREYVESIQNSGEATDELKARLSAEIDEQLNSALEELNGYESQYSESVKKLDAIQAELDDGADRIKAGKDEVKTRLPMVMRL